MIHSPMLDKSTSRKDHMMSRTREQIVNQDVATITQQLMPLSAKIEGMKFVVSGGAGFLGSWFCDVAIAMGAEVICIDNLIASTEENITNLLDSSRFSFIRASVEDVTIPTGADYIVHMASIASPPLYQRYPIETLNSAV